MSGLKTIEAHVLQTLQEVPWTFELINALEIPNHYRQNQANVCQTTTSAVNITGSLCAQDSAQEIERD